MDNPRAAQLCASFVVALFTSTLVFTAKAAPPVVPPPAAPPGWDVVKGKLEGCREFAPTGPGLLELKSAAPIPTPVEMMFHVRLASGARLTLSAHDEATNPPPAKPDPKAKVKAPKTPPVPAALECTLFANDTAGGSLPTVLSIAARSNGQPMRTDPISVRPHADKATGALRYLWRYPRVKNLWDPADRVEIGAAYDALVPLDQKILFVRLVLAANAKQIWIDDRLVAEERGDLPAKIRFDMSLGKGAEVFSAQFGTPAEFGRFLPLGLENYSHSKAVQEAKQLASIAPPELVDVTVAGRKVPVLVPKSATIDIDLGQSLYRYRATKGAGLDAGYVNATVSWPDAFTIDPASLTFRVPYRDYRNAWLLAWVDDKPNSVAAGAFRFFKAAAGYPASTDFSVDEDAIRQGRAVKLEQKTPAGKSLYLVRVPVNTDGFYGLRDQSGNFIEFELTKPLALMRSYPDPIYYGYHPAGLPSSVHVVGITLEEAPFGYEVKPTKFGHVFERPDVASYSVPVTNHSDKPIDAVVTLHTRSFDRTETATATASITVEPGKTTEAPLSLSLNRNGWHELKISVDAAGEYRENTLSLVMLPPNTRTYGNPPNETRFGLWQLLGHYTPMRYISPDRPDLNGPLLEMLRKIGMRRESLHTGFVSADLLKKYDYLPKAPHTIVSILFSLKENDPEQLKKAVDNELKQIDAIKDFPDPPYLYGGEWGISQAMQYSPWPLYTGDGDRDLTDLEKTTVARHIKIWSAIGKAMREKYPQAKLFLQWGSPLGTYAYLRGGFPKELADGFGMDEPEFELLPEVSNVAGSINNLWAVRKEAERLGWPRLPIHWVEGPFFPTNPGALTEADQANYQIRYWLLGLTYGIDQFEAGVVPYDAGNYYGAEHYGAGVFHRIPLENPKPAVAAIATATTMLCGADPAGSVETGSLSVYCTAFDKTHAGKKEKIYGIWRVTGTCDASLKILGAEKPAVTDAMGNTTALEVKDGIVRVGVSSSPVWITGVQIESISLAHATYDTAPAAITRPLAKMTADQWTLDHSEDKAYAQNHFAIRRITDPKLTAEFNAGEAGHEDAVAITLPIEPGDRPLANRYAALKLNKPVVIPGNASALGVWVKGNSSWGRIVFQLRDAKGELWTSNGSKDDWNCDDTHGWSYVNFDGWRYVRFPLPGTAAWDGSRELETTWWGSRGGDGVVDLPLTVEKIFVEARNEVPWLGEMKTVKERSYKLSNLIAEYASEENTTDGVVIASRFRQPAQQWAGPSDNPIARLTTDGSGTAPPIKSFTEPATFNDGRTMHIHFDATEGLKYNLYVSLFEDGRGADLLRAGVADGQPVRGFKPGLPVFVFLTAVGKDKKESKPSPAYRLVTEDHFAEK